MAPHSPVQCHAEQSQIGADHLTRHTRAHPMVSLLCFFVVGGARYLRLVFADPSGQGIRLSVCPLPCNLNRVARAQCNPLTAVHSVVEFDIP